jgi:hypothetical protein
MVESASGGIESGLLKSTASTVETMPPPGYGLQALSKSTTATVVAAAIEPRNQIGTRTIAMVQGYVCAAGRIHSQSWVKLPASSVADTGIVRSCAAVADRGSRSVTTRSAT